MDSLTKKFSNTTLEENVTDSLFITLKEDIEKEIGDNETIDGDTQKSERVFIQIVKKGLLKLTNDKPFKQASSQEPIDFQNVDISGTIYNFECKKVNKGNRFIFNDSVIDPDVYYIFCKEQEKKVLIIKGCNIKLLKENNDTTLEEDINILKKHVSDLTPETIDLNIVRFLFVSILSIAKHCVFKKIMSLNDYSELFKFKTDFGNISSRPRPNWSVTISF